MKMRQINLLLMIVILSHSIKTSGQEPKRPFTIQDIISQKTLLEPQISPDGK